MGSETDIANRQHGAMRRTRVLRLVLYFVVAVLSPLLFLGGPDYHSARSVKMVWSLGHVVLFCALFGLWVMRSRRSLLVQMLVAIAMGVLLGGTVEWLQGFVGRESSLSDLRLDVMGALFGVLWLGQSWKRLRVLGLGCLAVALVLMDLRPLLPALIDERQAHHAFPVLADFETPLQIDRWSSPYVMEIVSAPGGVTGHALRVDLLPARYSGLSLDHFYRDWSTYKNLSFRVFNPTPEELELTCRIHDVAHETNNRFVDRFNRRLRLVPGWNTIDTPLAEVRVAPRGRFMDLTQVAGFGCFIVDLATATSLYVDTVKLE